MFISDLKVNYMDYNLPERFVDCLPEVCETCGAPMEISETLTGLHCSNPWCKDKMVMRVRAVCNDLGILSFGESTIEKFIDTYNPDSPLDIFYLEEGMEVGDGVGDAVSKTITSQIVKKKKMLLWEYVMYANIPGIRTSARKIFQGYKSLDEAYADIEDGGVPFICQKLGTSGDRDVPVQAIKIYKNLLEFKDDLYSAIGAVELVDLSGVKELNVVCSDQVGNGFNKKSEFYAYINNNFADRVHVNFLPSVNKSIDYLVWAGADGTPARYTSKVKKVEGYRERGADIPIVTASQFIEIMEGMI